jgi:capsid protein
MSRHRTTQDPTLFSRETDFVSRKSKSPDLQAFNFFDAAYPSPENIQNWGHLQPECVEDITDPQTLLNLCIASICEVLNDDALNGMVAVGAESMIGTGCQMRVQCGFKHGAHRELEQYIEYLWDDWFDDVRYAQKLRTAQKDLMQFGSYFRRIIQNPHKRLGLDVAYVSPLRIQTPYDMEEGDYKILDGEWLRVYNGIAFDEYRNERFYCVSARPPFTNGYYDNAVYEWVSARHMCHVFDPQFSEQITGYPMTAPSLQKGVMRRQYEHDELRAARLGATLSGTFKTSADFKALFDQMSMQERQAIVKQLFDNFSRAGDSVPSRLDDFLNLPPLTEAQAFDTKHPHAGFASHRQESLKGQGRSLRMPEHLATGSSANYNYASVQKDSQSWHQHRMCFRQDIELIDLKQSFGMFLSIASVQDPALSPIFTKKIYPVVPTFYWKEEEHADPVKQVTSWLLLNQRGVLSHSDIMMRLGFDPENQKMKVKADMDEMRKHAIYDNGMLLQAVKDALAQQEKTKSE